MHTNITVLKQYQKVIYIYTMNTLYLITIPLSFLIHFIFQKLFFKNKIFDTFNERTSHKTLATRSGGVGIFVTVFLISLFFYFKKVDLFDYSLFIPLGIMVILGIYDDIHDADFKLKFLLQIIVAKILIDQGYIISNYYGFLGFYEIPRLLAQATTLFVFIVVVNSINFIDGIDGLAISEVIKIILLIEFFSEKNTPLYSLGVLTILSIIPLFYYNFKKKRKEFLGDGGSLLLGTLVVIYVLHVLGPEYDFKTNFVFNKTLFSILIIFYPLFDLLRVFLIRLINNKSPFKPDQNHLHHILHKKNIKPIYNVLLIQTISVLLFFIFLHFD